MPSQKRNFLNNCNFSAVKGHEGASSQPQGRLLPMNRLWPSWRSPSLSSTPPSLSLSLPSSTPLPRWSHQAAKHNVMWKNGALSRTLTAAICCSSHVPDDPVQPRCLTKKLCRCKALELSWEDAFTKENPEVLNQHYYFGESGRQTMVSETVAFASMGLHPADMLLSEAAMQTQMYPLPMGTKTPEGVFCPSDSSWLRNALPGCSRIAIEVKRIAFHRIPDAMPAKYKNLYLRLQGWYAELVQEAVDQISPAMARFFDIDGHVVFVAVPESMPQREIGQIQAELLSRVDLCSCAVPCVLTVQQVPDTAFARKILRHPRASGQ